MFGLPLYLRNAALSKLIKRGPNDPAYEMHKKREKNGGKERERNERKNGGSNRQKKKKKKKKTHMCIHFSQRDPFAMTFRECKF